MASRARDWVQVLERAISAARLTWLWGRVERRYKIYCGSHSYIIIVVFGRGDRKWVQVISYCREGLGGKGHVLLGSS